MTERSSIAVEAPKGPLHRFGSVGFRACLTPGLTVAAGALMMTWPAFLNGYALLNSDSVGYLEAGKRVARAVISPRAHATFFPRSEIYALGLLPWHWGPTLWPIIALNAALTAFVLWLVVRSFVPRRQVAWFLSIVALLSLASSLAWQVSWIMPDILGGVAYLCIYLLVFAWEGLSAAERWAVALIGWWSIAAHLTHFFIGVGLCALLGLLLALHWRPIRGRGRPLAAVCAVLASAAAVQIALHTELYGKPTLSGRHPPYLMARVIADGPGKWYLQSHCGQLNWAICKWAGRLPANSDVFLWSPAGVWSNASGDEQQSLRQEETPLVLATLRAYPSAQLRQSLTNFWLQLNHFAFYEFKNSDWMEKALDRVIPGSHARYIRTLQYRNAMPQAFANTAQQIELDVSLLVLLAGLPIAWMRARSRVLGLALILLAAIVANAFVCGVLSEVSQRYQNRVIWLVPLLALLLIADLVPNLLPVEQRSAGAHS